jgi:plastocyanin
LNPQLSKAIFGVGIALAIASIASIYVTMLATQNQNQSQQGGSAQQSSGASGSAQTTSQSSSSGGSGGSSISITIPNGAAAQASSLNNEYYKPITMEISSGSRVTWNNQDIAAHTSTSGQSNNSPDSGQLFNTGTISPGSSGSATVTGSGKIPYHCIFHPWMIASLQIGSTNSTASNSNSTASNSNATTTQST